MKHTLIVRTLMLMLPCLASSSLALAQATEEWVAIYDSPGSDDDEAYAMTVDAAGNVYVGGYSTDLIGYDQMHTVKYNADGVEQWSATHAGTDDDDDYVSAIAVDASGNVYVTGTANNTGTSSDLCTLMYDANGIEQWVANYSGPGSLSDSANDIAVDGSGNVFVTGYVRTSSGTDWDCVTIMYDASGTEQWVNAFDGTGNDQDYATALVVDGSSNVFVTGTTTNAAGNRDGLTIMYDSTGAQQWLNVYNGIFNGSDRIRGITLDGLGNVVVTGSTEIAPNDHACLTIQYNSSGGEQWTTIYNGVEGEGAGGSCITSDGLGNTYVGGYSDSLVTGRDFCTIKYDSNGVSQWVATYDGPANGHENVSAIALDGLGNVYVTGEVDTQSTDLDWATVMYDPLGVEQWSVAYDGGIGDFDRPNALAVDGSGNVFVAGISYDATGYVNFVTVKYAVANSYIGTMYGTAVKNSTGVVSSIFGSGDLVAANNAFGLVATGLPNGEFGYFIGSFGQAQVNMPGGSNGNLCVGGGQAIARFLPTLGVIAGGQISGAVDLTNVPLPPTMTGMILGGDTFNFQLWHREGGSLSGESNFTPGLEVTFQ
ncbi:MAG: hypothetical protein GY930_19780 [bacterium]|nr:hypothetical protein [bacterium]